MSKTFKSAHINAQMFDFNAISNRLNNCIHRRKSNLQLAKWLSFEANVNNIAFYHCHLPNGDEIFRNSLDSHSIFMSSWIVVTLFRCHNYHSNVFFLLCASFPLSLSLSHFRARPFSLPLWLCVCVCLFAVCVPANFNQKLFKEHNEFQQMASN